MTRVRCLFRHCLFNDEGTCSANEIELDDDGICLTAEEGDEAGFSGALDEDSVLDEWGEEEDEEWDEEM